MNVSQRPVISLAGGLEETHPQIRIVLPPQPQGGAQSSRCRVIPDHSEVRLLAALLRSLKQRSFS